MSIAILASKTGNGHISVMNSLANEFELQGYNDVFCFPDFYENMQVSNKILSDFYNFLVRNSPRLCNQYCEFSALTRSDSTEDFYNGVKKYLEDFFSENNFDIVVSVSHSINNAIARFLDESGLRKKTKFYVVITDPYAPIAVGYATPGADKYFCASDSVKDLLIRSKVDEKDIVKIGYPIHNKFTKIGSITPSEIGLKDDKKTILINSGSNGTNYYFDILKAIAEEDNQIIFISGNNTILYNKCKKYIQKNNLDHKCVILQYVNNIQDYYSISDLVITKVGANTFFEILQMQVPVLIDSVEGIIYQEKGIKNYAIQNNIGKVLSDISEVKELTNEMINEENHLYYKKNIQAIKYISGTSEIVKCIAGGE